MSDPTTDQRSVLVVDDQEMVRLGIRLMVDAEPDLLVVGEAADGEEAVELAAALRPDVVLMDVRIPRMDGIEATRRITAAGTAAAVVLVTTFDDEDHLLDGVRAGACGFLLKDAGAELLALAIRAALDGDAIIAPSMTRRLLEQRLQVAPAPGGAAAGRDRALADALERLSPRERDVLGEVARGATNAEIASRMWLSETTVKSHLSNLSAKVAATNRVQVAVFAYESGFVRPGTAREG